MIETYEDTDGHVTPGGGDPVTNELVVRSGPGDDGWRIDAEGPLIQHYNYAAYNAALHDARVRWVSHPDTPAPTAGESQSRRVGRVEYDADGDTCTIDLAIETDDLQDHQ